MGDVEWIGAREAARRLGVHENTIRNWHVAGVLTGRTIRPGWGLRFDVEDVERLGARRSGPGAAQDCLCNVGVQECPEHPGRLRTQEQKIAFRKAWDARVVADRSPQEG